MRINVFPHLSGAFSMKRYLNGLLFGLTGRNACEVVVHGYQDGEDIDIWKKYPLYWWKARSVRSGVNIVLSERFSFLLLVLRPLSTIIVCHDMVTLQNPGLTSVRKFRYRMLLRLMSRARFTVCISESTRTELLGLNPFIKEDRVRVIYNGIEPFWFEGIGDFKPSSRLQALAQKPFFLVVGTDSWNKNFSAIIQALQSMKPDGSFTLVKVGPLSDQNRRLAGEAGIMPYIYESGVVQDAELKWLYHHAIALLFPSLHEGFGWPPLEAMACSCPVIASHTSSVPEVCGEAAWYIDPHRPETLREAIETLLQQEEQRTKMKEKGRAQAAKFSWQTAARQFVQLVENSK